MLNLREGDLYTTVAETLLYQDGQGATHMMIKVTVTRISPDGEPPCFEYKVRCRITASLGPVMAGSWIHCCSTYGRLLAYFEGLRTMARFHNHEQNLQLPEIPSECRP